MHKLSNGTGKRKFLCSYTTQETQNNKCARHAEKSKILI
jgi:hypothetical protein